MWEEKFSDKKKMLHDCYQQEWSHAFVTTARACAVEQKR